MKKIVLLCVVALWLNACQGMSTRDPASVVVDLYDAAKNERVTALIDGMAISDTIIEQQIGSQEVFQQQLLQSLQQLKVVATDAIGAMPTFSTGNVEYRSIDELPENTQRFLLEILDGVNISQEHPNLAKVNLNYPDPKQNIFYMDAVFLVKLDNGWKLIPFASTLTNDDIISTTKLY